MPLTIDRLIDETIARLDKDPASKAVIMGMLDPSCSDQSIRDAVALILGAGLTVMDFSIDPKTKEIVDPRPAPPTIPSQGRSYSKYSGPKRIR